MHKLVVIRFDFQEIIINIDWFIMRIVKLLIFFLPLILSSGVYSGEIVLRGRVLTIVSGEASEFSRNSTFNLSPPPLSTANPGRATVSGNIVIIIIIIIMITINM